MEFHDRLRSGMCIRASHNPIADFGSACAGTDDPIYRFPPTLGVRFTRAQACRRKEPIDIFMIGHVPTFWFREALKGARSSAEEHYVDIVGVTGSIPVAPTILHYNIN